MLCHVSHSTARPDQDDHRGRLPPRGQSHGSPLRGQGPKNGGAVLASLRRGGGGGGPPPPPGGGGGAPPPPPPPPRPARAHARLRPPPPPARAAPTLAQ